MIVPSCIPASSDVMCWPVGCPCMWKINIAPHHCQHLVLSVFQNLLMVVSCCFGWQLSNNKWCLVSFHVLYFYLQSSLVIYLYRYFAHFLIEFFIVLLLSLKSSLCILGKGSLTDSSFVNIFSRSMACPLIPSNF